MRRPSSSFTAGSLCALVSTGLLVASTIAAGPASQRQADFRAEVDLVRLNVAVVNRSGGEVPPLSEEDFTVYDDDVPQRIELFLRPSDAPLEVALILDSSTSMRPVAGSARRAALSFLSLLDPDDCLLVLPFSTRVGPGRRGRAVDPGLRRFIDQGVAGGGTALYDALLRGLDELTSETSAVDSCPGAGDAGSASSERRKAVVLLSDGADEDSDAKFDDVLLAARQASIPVFPVAFGYAYQDSRLEARLTELARATGGRRLQSATPARLRQAYVEAVEYLKTSYVLGYHPDGESGAGEQEARRGPGGLVWHEVRVELRRPLLDVIVRPGYYR